MASPWARITRAFSAQGNAEASLIIILCYFGLKGILMPRKDTKPVRGLWQREPGSDIWWIRYRAGGVLKREKVGSKGNAIKLLKKLKNQLMEGIKLGAKMWPVAIAAD
jgi:hypothetical protein